MSEWEDLTGKEHDVTDLDTARLALRGALQSARSLQDLNSKLKGELQDFLHREKALNERLIRLQTELNDSYARLDKEVASDRDRVNSMRETLRLEITAEQNHKWQTEIEALRQSVQNWTEVRRQKENELKVLKETMLAKEQEVFTLQKEKMAAEEKAHRDLLDTLKQSRAGVAAAIEEVVKSKDKEISDLSRKLATQPKIIEERLQQVEQELHRKEQSLLLQFRDRQQALEFDWAHREKELWERATESREALERDLKNQWEERRKTLEDSLANRQANLEIKFRQQDEETKRRERAREEALHQAWVAKEAALASEWALREQDLARELQQTLDKERQRASEEMSRLKEETENWRKIQSDTLSKKEQDLNKAHQAAEQQLRNAYRKKEEDLLARHQEVLEMAQHQISDLMTKTSEKESYAKSAQERLAAALKEREALAERLARVEADALHRNAELEALVKVRDQELSELNKTTTTRDESRIVEIQALERDQLQKESELKVVREKISQAEADRKAALDHAAALENEFTLRQQQLEEAFRAETETLRARLAASSQESAERQQTDQRHIAELGADVQSRVAEVQGLTHQLQLARRDIEKLSLESSDKQTKSLMIRRQLEERLVQRELELSHQIETLEKERLSIEERLEARITELEQELARRLSEDRSLQERFRQNEEFRVDLEQQADMLRDRLAAHEKQKHVYEDEVRIAREKAEKERIAAEQVLLLRIGELETTIAKQAAEVEGVREELQRNHADRAAELQSFETREKRLMAQGRSLEERLKVQENELNARLSSVQEEHVRIENALRQQIQTQDASHLKVREQLVSQVTELEGHLRRRELDIKALKEQAIQEERTRQDVTRESNQREAALEERAQFLYKTLETQKTELENRLETADREHLKIQDALRAQVVQLEADLGRKTGEVEELKARLLQARLLQNELNETVAFLEAQSMDREQTIRTAAQNHLESEQKLERSITELQSALQHREADFKATEKRMQELQHERQAEMLAAAEREKQLEERLQNVDEKLRTQKEQITARLTGVERQRLQTEEALHVRALDLEQRLAQKTGLVKNLQEQITRSSADQEHLEKKITSLEAHLARMDQQVKVKETEYQSLKSTSQKELATLHEANQRKLLELQGQRLALEADFKGLQEALAAADKEKTRLADQKTSFEERLRIATQDHRVQMDTLLKERMSVEEAHQRKVLELNEALAARTTALQTLENRFASSEGQRTDQEKQTTALQKEIHDLQLSLAAQQEEFRARMSGFEKERMQLQESQQNRITHLESQLTQRESALRSLQEKIAQSDADHQSAAQIAAQREAALEEKAKTLETTLTAQKQEWNSRMESLLSERVSIETNLHGRVVHLQESLALREKDLVMVKETLQQVEEARRLIEASAQETASSFTKERQVIEERLVNEVGKVRDLESQLRGHAAHIKEADKAIVAGEKEREALRASLAALNQKLDEEIAVRDSAYDDKAQVLQSKMQSIETEWRDRFDASAKASAMRIEELQGKIVELECALGIRENDLSSLQQQIAELSVDREKLSDLVLQKDREHDTLVAAMERDKKDFSTRLEMIQTDRKSAEEALSGKLKHLRESLEQQLRQEQERAQGLDTQLAAQVSELRQLKGALAEAKEERERLLTTLAAEREKAANELKSREQSTVTLESGLRTQLQNQAEEFRKRLVLAEQEATKQLSMVQTRVADLEKALTAQRADYEQRAALAKAEYLKLENARTVAMQAERDAAEKELHARLLELRDSLAARVADVQRLELQLRETERERAALDQYSTASHAEATQRREELERQVVAERKQVQLLETQCKDQMSELKQLREALDSVRSEREDVLATLAEERQNTSQELKGRQKAMAEMENALRARFETQIKEAADRFSELQSRTMDLERQATEKQASVERLQEALREMDAARIVAQDQWTLEAKARHAEKQAAAQAKEEFSARLNALQSERKASEDALHQRLLELQDALTARTSDIQKLDLQVKESERARAALEHYSSVNHAEAVQRHDALERDMQTERERANALDTQLTAQVSELSLLKDAFAAARAEREQLLATLAAEREKAASAIKGLEKKAAGKESILHAQVEAQEKEFRSRLAAVEAESAQRLAALQARTSELEKTMSVQRAEFEQRVAVMGAERVKIEKAMQLKLSEIQGLLVTRNGELESLKHQLAAAQKERMAFETASSEQKNLAGQHIEVLRGRVIELERQTAEKQTTIDRLKESLEEVSALRTHAEQQWAIETQERRAAQAAAAQGKEEFTRLLTSLQAEHQAREDALHKRLHDLRGELEQRLNAERDKTQTLDTQLAAQLSELQQLRSSLEETRVERQRLLEALAKEREKSTLQAKHLSALTSAQEQEFRDRLLAADAAATQRMGELQMRAAELEKTLSQQRADFEQRIAIAGAERVKAEKAMQLKLSEIQNLLVARNGELESLKQQLLAAQKERTVLEHSAGEQTQHAKQQVELLRTRILDLERQTSEKQSALDRLKESMDEVTALKAHAEEQWMLETQERRATQAAAAQAKEDFVKQLSTVHAEHTATEETLHKRLLEMRTELERRVNAEHEKTQALDTQLAAQLSELQQLRSSLEEVRLERQKLLQLLSAEREKLTLETKDRDVLSQAQKQKYEQRLAAQEKDFRERLAAADTDAAQRVAHLQARASELEKLMAAQHSDYERQLALQRSEHEQRLALLQAERMKSEKGLQASVSDLQSNLIARTKELESIQERLSTVDGQRLHSESEQKQFEARLVDERARAHDLELVLKAQNVQLKNLQEAFSAAQKENLALTTLLEDQQKKMQVELAGRESAVGEQKNQYEQRLAALTVEMRERLQTAAKETAARTASLLTRVADLERQGSDKQAALDRLRESLTELETKRAHAEAQWAIETQERRAVQEAMAREKEDFALRLQTLHTEHKKAEEDLTQQLLGLRDSLAARADENQRLEQQLKETEQARAALEHYSSASHADLTRAQENLAQDLNKERDRAKGLETRLAAQVSELKQLRTSLADAQAEREAFLTSLAAEREKVTADMKAQDALSAEGLMTLRAKMEAAEKEFRNRLQVSESDHAKRMAALQTRTAELEKALLHERSEHEQRLAIAQAERIKLEKSIQAQLSQLEGQLTLRSAELEAVQRQVADAHTEREALKKITEEQKVGLENRYEQLQHHALNLEQQIAEKQADMQRLQETLTQLETKRAYAEAQWALETQERRAAQEASAREKEDFANRLKALEAERKASEDTLQKRLIGLRDNLTARGVDIRNLEQRLQETEQMRVALQQAAALSQTEAVQKTKELENHWAAERARVRELDSQLKANAAQIKDLKEALTTEQKQYKASQDRNEAYEQRIEELHARTVDLERLGTEKQAFLDRLRETLAELESRRSQAEKQKDELAARLVTIQAERKAAEDELHQRLSDMKAQLEHRLHEEGVRARGLDTQLANQVAELKQLRIALADEKSEREQLSKTLAAEREKALLELKGREKASAESTSTLWMQMEAQEKEFRLQLTAVEQEAGRRVAVLQVRAAELEKTLATQRSEFEQRLNALQKDRSSAEEKLHAKIFTLEENLSRRIAEAQKLYAEFAAVESARSVAEESSAAVHGELVRLQAQFDERVAQDQSQARALEQQLQQYKSQAREWKDALTAAKEERRVLEAGWASEKQKLVEELRLEGASVQQAQENHERRMVALDQEWTSRLNALTKESALRLQTVQNRLSDMERQLAQRERDAAELKATLGSLEEERARLVSSVAREEEAKELAVQRVAALEERLEKFRHDQMQTAEQLQHRISDLNEQLEARSIEIKNLRDTLRDAEAARKNGEKSLSRDQASWEALRHDLEEKLAIEREKSVELQKNLSEESLRLKDLQQSLAVLERERDVLGHAADGLRNKGTELEKTLAQREVELAEMAGRLRSAQDEQQKLQDQLLRADQEKTGLVERLRTLDQQMTEERQVFENRLDAAQRTHIQGEQKMRARLLELEDHLNHKSAALNQLEDRLQQLQKSNDELQKSLERDSTGAAHHREELEKKLAAERARLRDMESEQASQKTVIRDLHDALEAAEKERRNAVDVLKAQKERFLADLALRDAGSAQRQRALELEREALDKQWQERLKSATQETVERMETLRRRADDLEKQLSSRATELHQVHEQVTLLEQERRELNDHIETLNRDRKEDATAAAAERARLVERYRDLEEKLQQQSQELTQQMEHMERDQAKAQENLQHRLNQAQDQLAKRSAELKSAEERVRLVEESRGQLEKSAGQGHSQWSRERAQLEERLASERSHVKELSRQLAEATAQTREIQEAVATAEQERRSQMKTISAQQENEKILQQRIAALEKEVRHPTVTHSKDESATKVQEFRLKAEALEHDLAARETSLERLREEAERSEREWAHRLEELEARQAADIEKRVAEKLREQMMGALESGQLKGGDSAAMQTLLEEWVFGFAHQVRNPLGIIRSVAESLLEAEARRKEKDSLSAIVKAVDGLNLRLKEFIEFSKPVKPLMQSVDVPSAVTAAIKWVEEKGLPGNITISTALPAQGTRLWMDPDHLRTILVHLLRNAIESMPKGGRIRLEASTDAKYDRLELRVKDEGSGIPREHMKEVGRPFFSTKPGAIGLGLALIKRLLRAYDGKLDIESRAGQSTTVTCRLKTKHEQEGKWAA